MWTPLTCCSALNGQRDTMGGSCGLTCSVKWHFENHGKKRAIFIMAGPLQTHKPPSGPSAAQSLKPSSGIVVLFCCAAPQTYFKAFDVSPSGRIYIVINIFTWQELPDIQHDGTFHWEEKNREKKVKWGIYIC